MNSHFTYPGIDRWENLKGSTRDYESGCVELSKNAMWVGKNYDLQHMIHSLTGKGIIDASEIETRYSDIADPGLVEYWAGFGLEYTVHLNSGRPWLSFVPKSAMENSKKLPAILVFRPACVFAQSFYYQLNLIAAQGEVILLYFSTESVEENEQLVDILREACDQYPIDESRVYATGHSHYGEFVSDFASRHPNLIAAVAQQCDSPGISPAFGSGDLVERLHAIDMPTILISGYAEMCQVFPVNVDAPTAVDERWQFIFPQTQKERIALWRKRLYALNCPDQTEEQIMAAAYGTHAERMLGFPADHSETMHVDGLDYAIGDMKNNDGHYHFRIVCIENFPHSTCAFMHTLCWSFLRRFARDRSSNRTVERFI